MSKDVAESIRARLLKLAKERKEDFDFVLRNFVMQRLLYRLSVSEYKDQFLLKGALLFWVWNKEFHRPTVDIDLLGFGAYDVEALVGMFKGICKIADQDGLEFDIDSIKGFEIKEDAKYQGVRLIGFTYLTKAKIRFQVDIGFGDAVTPAPTTALLSTFLNFPEPEIWIYPVYTVIAEKFQAMVDLDLANSRIKDFYDIWVIAGQVELDGEILAEAIQATFVQRNTETNQKPLNIFTDTFKNDEGKQIQWKSFLKKNRLLSDFSFFELMNRLEEFLLPVYESFDGVIGFRSKTWWSEEWEWLSEVVPPTG